MAKKDYGKTTPNVWTFDSGIAVHTLALDEISDDIKATAIGHGILQKVGDSYAGAASAVENSEMTVEEYIDGCIADSLERLRKGDWNLRAGGAGPRVTDLAQALAEAYDITPEEAAERIKDWDAETKKATRVHPAIAPILDRIRAERAAAKAAKSEAEAGDATLPDLPDF